MRLAPCALLAPAAQYALHALRHFYASWCINRVDDGSLGLERLGTGDSVHVTGTLPIEWIDPLARRSVPLCLANRRPDLSGFRIA